MKVRRICVYFRGLPETDRWVRGDRHLRPALRRVIRGRPRPGGIDKVFVNLCRGLEKLDVRYEVNPSFASLRAGDAIAVLGRGRDVLSGYDRPFPIVAGIGLMTHPAEWPALCDEYPVVTYLSHSRWVSKHYERYFGAERCREWPVGIDTEEWRPANRSKTTDFLIYDKLPRRPGIPYEELLAATKRELETKGFSFEVLRYGAYVPSDFSDALARARAMIFLSPHESQGIACGEALSSDVPVLAWDPGRWTDPNRLRWGEPNDEATSVPYFDERCGLRFHDLLEFPQVLEEFRRRGDAGAFQPRSYVLNTLTLPGCAQRLLDYMEEAQTPAAAGRISPAAKQRAAR